MAVEVRVRCEHPGCEETKVAVTALEEALGSVTAVRFEESDRFHFTLDSDWIDAPEGWTLGDGDQILCPKHAPAEPSS